MKSKWIFIGLLFALIVQESLSVPAPRPNPEDDSDEEKSDESKSNEKEDSELSKEEPESSKDSKAIKEDTGEGGFRFAVCQGQQVVTPEPIIKAQKVCAEEKKKLDPSNKNVSICCAVCVWEKMDFLLGEHQKLDSSAVDDLVDVIFTGPLEHSRPVLKKEWKNCKKQIGDEDEDDKHCKRFKKYFACLVASYEKVCTQPVTEPPKGFLLNLFG